MHLSGMPSGVSQTVLKGSLRSLLQARLGALSRKVDSQARHHASGIEISQPSHWVDDIPSITGPISRARLIRLAFVGFSLSSRAYSFGILSSDDREISHILPATGSSTRTMIISAVDPPTVMTPTRLWPGGSPSSTEPFGSSLIKLMAPWKFG